MSKELHKAADVKMGVCPVLRPWFVSFTGDTTAALMFNQVLFWWGSTKLKEGVHPFFVRSDQEFASELFVSRNTVIKARKRLEKLKVSNTEDRAMGGTHKRCYFLAKEYVDQFKKWVWFVGVVKSLGYEIPVKRNDKQFDAVLDLLSTLEAASKVGSDSEFEKWKGHLSRLHKNNWTMQN